MFNEQQWKDISGQVKSFDETDGVELIPLRMIEMFEAEEAMLNAVTEMRSGGWKPHPVIEKFESTEDSERDRS
jgi:hypothetical protein